MAEWEEKLNQIFQDEAAMGQIMSLAQTLSQKENGALIGELIKLALGPIYAYFIINTLDSEDFNVCMKFILLFGIIGYILEIGTGTFNLNSLSQINFFESYSPFESSYAAGTAVTAATYTYFSSPVKLWCGITGIRITTLNT